MIFTQEKTCKITCFADWVNSQKNAVFQCPEIHIFTFNSILGLFGYSFKMLSYETPYIEL
jgi:hypothetical protein